MKQKHDFRLAAYTFSKCGLNEEALHTMELSKGRALAERYASRLADASDVITPEESRRMEKLRWQLAANNQRLNEYLNTPGTANQLEKRQDLDRDKEQSELEYREYRAALQNKYPKYKELSEPRVPTAREAGKLLPEGTVYLSFIAFEGEVMALLLTPDGQVHTVDMDDVPALNQKVQAYRILLSYPTFYKQQQVQMFLWQGADQQVKAAAAAPEPGARRLEKPEELQAARQIGRNQ